MKTDVNGFIFNSIGDLIFEPEHASLELLEDTLTKLCEQQEYIKASRIQNRINAIEIA